MKTEYRVWWNSPRGFANEGDYVFGTKDDCDKLIDGNVHCALISKHRSLGAALGRDLLTFSPSYPRTLAGGSYRAQ